MMSGRSEIFKRNYNGLVIVLIMLFFQGCGGGPKVTDQQPQAGQPADVEPGEAEGRLPYSEPTIRVLLKQGFREADVINSTLGSDVRLRVLGGMIELALKKGSQWVVSESRTGFRLYPESGKFLGFGRNHYRGVIDIFINPLGVPVAVNEVGLENYLKSVVPSEMGPDAFPRIEALKAQAVAARTFAVRELDRNAVHGFDVHGDSRAQNYRGTGNEHPLSSRAVESTSGLIAVFRGKPILAMYSSTCGGKTEAYHNIFKGDPIPYLAGGVDCDDEESPYHRWSDTIQVQEIQKSLDLFAGVGRIRDLRILDKSPSGRTISMRFSGDRGEKVLRGNDLRFALGLRSNHIDSFNLHRDSQGFIETIAVSGRGWGHGVGLCQTGAVAMAGRGEKFDEILHHYYRNIKLVEWKGR